LQIIPSSLATAEPLLMKQCRRFWRLFCASHKSYIKGWSSLQTSEWTSTSLLNIWHLQRSHTLHSDWRWLCLDRGGILHIYVAKITENIHQKIYVKITSRATVTRISDVILISHALK